jgi:hypothetical protein
MSISVHRTHNFLPSLDTGYEEKFHKMCSAGKIQLRRWYLFSHKQRKEKGRRVSALPVCWCSSRKRAKQLHWLTSSSKLCSTAQGNLSGVTTKSLEAHSTHSPLLMGHKVNSTLPWVEKPIVRAVCLHFSSLLQPCQQRRCLCLKSPLFLH